MVHSLLEVFVLELEYVVYPICCHWSVRHPRRRPTLQQMKAELKMNTQRTFRALFFLIFEVFFVVFLFALNSSVAPFHVSAHFSTNQHLAHAYDIRVQRRAVVILEYCTGARLRWVKTPSPLAVQRETDADGRICRTINYTTQGYLRSSPVCQNSNPTAWISF